MHDCQHYQGQMLDHLYGLLEETESAALLAHLDSCAACLSELEKVRGQQQLLATAAKGTFPRLQFEVPAEPVTLPIVPAPVERWRGWALAAAVLLVVGGLGGPTAWLGLDYLRVQTQVAQHREAVAQAQREQNTIQAEMQQLPQEENRKLQEVVQAARQRELNVIVSGPACVQVGAPNEYRIQTQNLDGDAMPAHLDVLVVDEKGQAVFQEKDVHCAGEHRLKLEPTLPLRPDTRLALQVTARRDQDPDSQSQLREHLELAAPVYVTHLMTDKPMYQPGETVRFRSLTLDRFSLKPPEEDFRLLYTITKPTQEKVEVVAGMSRLVQQEGAAQNLAGPDGKPLRGVGAGEYVLDPDVPGGEYTLTVSEANDRWPAQQRKFVVNRYQPGQLNKELNFARSSYGTGETVAAACRAARADGTPVADRPVRASVFIDGQSYGSDGKPAAGPVPFRTDAKGEVTVVFKLPTVLPRGEGTLTVTFDDGGNVEPIVRTIPIVLKKLQLEFFPEGGDLIAGASNRVYFQVRTTLDKPADLRGRLLDDQGKVAVADVRTLNDPAQPGVNQGMGVFAFTPETGRTYELKIDTPNGVEGRYLLPAVRQDGVVLSVPDGVTGPKDPIRVQVHSAGAERALLVGAYCRGRLLDHQSVTVRAGKTVEVALRPSRGVGGVYRITVFEERAVAGAGRQQLVPVAERLVYREPAERLRLEVQADRPQYIPGEKVKLSLSARDEDGKSSAAVLALGVVDKRILTLADEKTARSMPTHFLLTTEVRRPEDLEFADFLLSDLPSARRALDLLLGTQGWRRFAEQNPVQFRERFKEDADRLLVTIGRSSPRVTDFAQQDQERLRREFRDRQEALQSDYEAASAALATQATDPAARAAAERLSWYQDWFNRFGRFGTPVLGVLLIVMVIVGLLLGLPRRLARAVPLYAGLAACATLLLTLTFVREGGLRKAQNLTVAELAPAMQLQVEEPGMDRAIAGEDRAVAQAKPMEAAPPPAPPNMLAPGIAMDKGEAKKLAKKDNFAFAGKGEAFGRLAQLRRGAGDPGRKMAKAAIPGWAGDNLRLEAQARGSDKRQAGRFAAPAMPPRDLDGRFRRAGELPMAAGLMREMLEKEQVPPPLPSLVVREYAHVHTPSDNSGVRTDFTETLFWHPALVIGEAGKADVSFDLCDSVTTFEIVVCGHTLNGRLGSATTLLTSRLPFALEPKTPIEVTSNDRIDLPVSISNNTPISRSVRLAVTLKNLKLLEGKSDDQLTVGGSQVTRRIFPIRPDCVEGEARIEILAQTEPFAADAIARTFRIVPDGFPIVGSKSDVLEGFARHDVLLPETWLKGTLKCQVQVYPSTLASLEKGLESLLREPCGCFEQTSTSNYPNLLILDYLKESDQVRPEIEARARRLLSSGYDKLVSYECPQSGKTDRRGYEWFGAADSAHEALTAYGLLQFRDMAQVQQVDPNMLERTRQYLLASRDGEGGFKRNQRALDTFGRAPEDITNAYIVWALTESSKEDDVTKELDALARQAKDSKDAYFLALVANSLLNRDQAGEGVALLKTAVSLQKPDGHLDAERTSITGSGGRDLQIETTALAVLGWLKANRPADFNVPVQNAVKWIGQQRGGFGGFGSTQATILALKALIAFTRANKKTPEAGELSLLVGGQRVGQRQFPAGAQDVLAIELPEPEKHLKAGKNDLRVEITGKNTFPYTLSWSYQTLKPPSAAGCAVRLTTQLDRQTASEGDTVHLNVVLENVTERGQGMAVAIIGLPAGLSLPEDLKQLKEHARLREDGRKPGLISSFETRGRELILYWRDLGPRQKIAVPVDLVCRVPGVYRGPASRAYLYYNADQRWWVEPLEVKLTAKAP